MTPLLSAILLLILDVPFWSPSTRNWSPSLGPNPLFSPARAERFTIGDAMLQTGYGPAIPQNCAGGRNLLFGHVLSLERTAVGSGDR